MAADTENNTLVRQYIVSTLRALDWHVEEDTFIDNTPLGPKRFTNVIATHDPDASRRVVLSAHFDSKYFSSYPHNQVSQILPQMIHLRCEQSVVCGSHRFGCVLCNDA
jgi:hypothetical protein